MGLYTLTFTSLDSMRDEHLKLQSQIIVLC
jgi:hypothetical protein